MHAAAARSLCHGGENRTGRGVVDRFGDRPLSLLRTEVGEILGEEHEPGPGVGCARDELGRAREVRVEVVLTRHLHRGDT